MSEWINGWTDEWTNVLLEEPSTVFVAFIPTACAGFRMSEPS